MEREAFLGILAAKDERRSVISMKASLPEIHRRLREVLALKSLPRAGWRRAGVEEVESVAAHSWGVAWLVLALCPEGVDRGRALALAVLHDLAEVRVGDITPHDDVTPERKHELEQEALRELVAPFAAAEELEQLWLELELASTAEGRFVRACDRLDMALQAQHYQESQGVDTSEFVHSALEALTDEELRRLAKGG
jgi:putative hydrolases of HD superfamily